MSDFSQDLNFEKAQEIKDKILQIESFTSKSIVVNFKVNNIDVLGLMDDENYYYVNFMKVNNGMIIGSETTKIKKKLSFDYSEIGQILFDLKLKYGSMSNDTLSNINLKNSLPDNINLIVPKVGDKKKLIDMSLKNVLFYKKNLYNEKKERKTKKMSVLIDLKNKLNLKAFHSILNVSISQTFKVKILLLRWLCLEMVTLVKKSIEDLKYSQLTNPMTSNL